MTDPALPPATGRFLARRLRLAQVDRGAWLLDGRLQSGRRLAIAAFPDGELTALPAAAAAGPSHGPARGLAHRPAEGPATVVLWTAHGALRLQRSQAMEWLCLLAGLPLPAVQADDGARQWRAALAVTRMPAEVRQCWGPLSCNWSDPGMPPAATDRRLTLRLARDGLHCHLDAWAPAAAWLGLLSAFEPIRAQAVGESLACAWRLDAGACALAPAELAALQAGDVLRLHGSLGVEGVAVLDLGVASLRLRLQARGRTGRRTIWQAAVLGRAEQPTPSAMENPAMTDDPENTLPPQEPPVAATPGMPPMPADEPPIDLGDGLRIELRAELGMLDMTLGELRELRPGSLVAIRSRGPAEVTLYAAPDSAFAEGFLVDIDGQLGVEITRRIHR